MVPYGNGRGTRRELQQIGTSYEMHPCIGIEHMHNGLWPSCAGPVAVWVS